MFLCSFPVDGEVFWQLVSDLLATRQTVLTCQVRNKLPTSRCNGIWKATRHNRHNGLLPEQTCYWLVTDLLQGNWSNEPWPLHSHATVTYCWHVHTSVQTWWVQRGCRWSQVYQV